MSASRLDQSMSLASPRLHYISAAPAALDRYPRGVAGHVAHPVRLHSRCYPRSFIFYVAVPNGSIRRGEPAAKLPRLTLEKRWPAASGKLRRQPPLNLLGVIHHSGLR
jgi:hypothetical protein